MDERGETDRLANRRSPSSLLATQAIRCTPDRTRRLPRLRSCRRLCPTNFRRRSCHPAHRRVTTVSVTAAASPYPAGCHSLSVDWRGFVWWCDSVDGCRLSTPRPRGSIGRVSDPGLDQLTGVTLSIRSDSVVLASRDVTPDDAVAKIAATLPRFESPTVSGAVPEASPVASEAVQPNTSIDEIVSPRQQRHQHDSPQPQASPLQATVAADQNSTASVAKSANHPLR